MASFLLEEQSIIAIRIRIRRMLEIVKSFQITTPMSVNKTPTNCDSSVNSCSNARPYFLISSNKSTGECTNFSPFNAMPKILVSGDVGGDLAALFQRVSTVHSGAAGPFECLFCVGEVTQFD